MEKLVGPLCGPSNNKVASLARLLRHVRRARVPRLDLTAWKDDAELLSDAATGCGDDVDIAGRAFVTDCSAHYAPASRLEDTVCRFAEFDLPLHVIRDLTIRGQETTGGPSDPFIGRGWQELCARKNDVGDIAELVAGAMDAPMNKANACRV